MTEENARGIVDEIMEMYFKDDNVAKVFRKCLEKPMSNFVFIGCFKDFLR